MKKLILCLCLLSLSFSSCKKFLAETSQNLAYVKTASDLAELLTGEGYMKTISNISPSAYSSITFGTGTAADWYFPELQVMDDDAEEFAVGNTTNFTGTGIPRNVLSGFHRWQQSPLTTLQGVTLVDYDWTRFYKHIAVLNAIIYKAQDLRGKDNEVTLNRVEGEARFLRAGYYFLLVNLYGLPYNKATASTDLGVPLKTSENVEDDHFSRTPVGTVYNQMIADLTRAAACLNGISQVNFYHVTLPAVYAMLSRINLYMENYQAASAAADQVIAAGYQVVDLNSYATGSSFCYYLSPENIFSQGGYTTNDIFVDDNLNFDSSYKVSTDLLSAFSSTDLRLKAFFTQSTSTKQPLPVKCRTPATDANAFTPMSSNFLIRFPEVLLNKAEAQALMGDNAGAQTTLQILRAKRFKPADLTAVTLTGADLVNFIRDERRRELCFEGQRWFDLKRYAVNSVYPYTKTIQHKDYEYSTSAASNVVIGRYQLNPYPQEIPAYMVPIPVLAIQFNMGTLTNMDRPARAIQP